MKRPFAALMSLAHVTLMGALRNRLLLVTVGFGVVLIFLSMAAASVSIGEKARLIIDVGLAATSMIGSIVGIALTNARGKLGTTLNKTNIVHVTSILAPQLGDEWRLPHNIRRHIRFRRVQLAQCTELCRQE